MVDCSDSALKQAYEDVRSDKNPTTWAVFGYESPKKVVLNATGQGGWAEFENTFDDGVVQFGFVRVTTGDNESKRAKFVFVSWIGSSVGPLARAKVSVHKASVKEVVRDFACEIHAETRDELDEAKVLDKVTKAGGANYGTGSK